MPSLIAFAAVAVVFGVTPGPDVMLVIRQSVASGPRHGLAVALGAATGSLAWGMAAAFGLARLISSSHVAYAVVRYSGALYLIVLGIQGLRSHVTPDAEQGTTMPRREASSSWTAFRTGLIADLLNPKMGAFYLALLPQFIPAGGNVIGWSIALMAIELSIAVIALSAYALAASRASTYLRRPKVARRTSQILAVTLIGLGAKVATT